MSDKPTREREAIRAVMRDMGVPVTYQEISDRAGPRLASTLMEMVQAGEVVRTDPTGGQPATYHASSRGGSSAADPRANTMGGRAP